MPSVRLSLAFVFLAAWPWAQCVAQIVPDPSILRFTHSFELHREEMLVECRNGAALQFLTAAREIVELPEGSGRQRSALLGELQHLADSITALDGEIGVLFRLFRIDDLRTPCSVCQRAGQQQRGENERTAHGGPFRRRDFFSGAG